MPTDPDRSGTPEDDDSRDDQAEKGGPQRSSDMRRADTANGEGPEDEG